ncbi:MAG: NIPSNAP family protein [Anaerolineae bacterium]
MILVERHVQQLRPDKWEELEALEKKFDAVESALGFPAKRRYRCYFGGHNINTHIIERQWESMAAMEAAYEKAHADPEWQALGAEGALVIESVQIELYAPLP